MRKYLIALSALIFISTAVSPTYAVENGVDATGSSFVVPISIMVGNNEWASCSGALIAPSIVVTAAHCAVNSEGLQTNYIYVGQAGSSLSSINYDDDDSVSSVTFTSTYEGGSNETVGDDDVAFLTLNKPQTIQTPVILASADEIAQLQASNAPLTLVGYGEYSDFSSTPITFPMSYDGNYSPIPDPYPNSSYLASTTGDACEGDSGAPILNISESQVLLVGVDDGAARSHYCTKMQPDGTYLTDFILIDRYANLAFSAATNELTFLQDQLDYANQGADSNAIQDENLNSELRDAQNQLNTSNAALTQAENKLALDDQQIAELQKKLKTTLVCKKGRLTRTVTGIAPKCPTGFTP